MRIKFNSTQCTWLSELSLVCPQDPVTAEQASKVAESQDEKSAVPSAAKLADLKPTESVENRPGKRKH